MTGAVTRALTGALTGPVTRALTGALTGPVTGALTGTLTGALASQAPKVRRAKRDAPGREWSKHELRSLEDHLMGLGVGRSAELRENVRAAHPSEHIFGGFRGSTDAFLSLPV